MIRRSTFILLACVGALSVPAIQTKSAASPTVSAVRITDRSIIAQATPNTTAAAFQPLGIGARGEAVRSLQRRLIATDYYSGPVDGLYGLETQRAVVALQRAVGIEDTGTLNEATWQALEAGGQSTFEFNNDDADSESVQASTEVGAGGAEDGSEAIASVENEMPSATTPTEPIVIEDDPPQGLNPMLALGIGALALLGSFGVGFYMANRGKRAGRQAGSSGEIGLDTVGVDVETDTALRNRAAVPAVPTNPALKERSQLEPGGLLRNSAPANGQTNYAASSAQIGQPVGYQASYQIDQTVAQTGPLSQMDVIEGLLGELHNPDPAKRRKAIWELGQRGNSIAVQPLVDAMPNADSKEKSLLLAALSEIGIRSMKPMNRAMAIAFQDPNPEVRKNAIRDLSRVYDIVVQISHMLGHATEDDDPEVRQTAAWALDKLNMIRKSQDMDSNMRSFSGSGATPIDLLSSEASIRRSQEMR